MGPGRQLPIPDTARELLRRIPSHFVDDGCTSSPDGWFGFDFRWACRIHDWLYCTRAHPAGTMTYEWKVKADHALSEFIRASLPLRWRWVRWVYEGMVLFAGGWGSFDSCGPEVGKRCRHGLRAPWWMLAPESTWKGSNSPP